MVKHIVMWSLKDKAKAPELKKCIEGMKGHVSTLVDVECGINVNPADAACDLVLISLHNSKADLDLYQKDPVHGEVKKIIGPQVLSRHVVDFEY